MCVYGQSCSHSMHKAFRAVKHTHTHMWVRCHYTSSIHRQTGMHAVGIMHHHTHHTQGMSTHSMHQSQGLAASWLPARESRNQSMSIHTDTHTDTRAHMKGTEQMSQQTSAQRRNIKHGKLILMKDQCKRSARPNQIIYTPSFSPKQESPA
mmetsp:Transcript_9546/g.23384  ORF Transcript_9546/g.23384 Transcript_9546/m.23384 type:complete len:151 (+) Transcript_9546:1162-1614(+)